VQLKRQMIEWWGPIIWEYYAGTEGPGSTLVNSEEWLRKPGTVGRITSGTIHILDEVGTEVSAGELGSIYFESPTSTGFRYHGDDAKTAASRTAQGWSTMGDIGYLDEDAYLFLTDRKAFTIISGGVNVYPQEAENVLSLHASVADVAVFGVADDDLGEVPMAVVQVAVGVTPSTELANDLLAYCRERLASIKCPRSIAFEDELPRLPTGKLYKQVLRDRYRKG
jgi:long-chain acyl-CoA synthetase